MENIISNTRKNIYLLAKKEINTISFAKVKSKEIDLFYFYLIALKENNFNKVTICFEEIKKILDIKRRNKETILNLVLNSNKILKSLQFIKSFKDENGKENILLGSIIDRILINKDDRLVIIWLHNDFKPILSHINTGNFTKIDLLELINLKSSYSKKLYPILKQQEDKGIIYNRKLDNWKELLGISKDRTFRDFNQTVLTPAINELQKYFKNLKIVINKEKNIITHFGFKFTPNKIKYDKEIIENKKEKNIKKNSLKKDNHKLLTEKTNFNDYHIDEYSEYENPPHIQKKLEEIW